MRLKAIVCLLILILLNVHFISAQSHEIGMNVGIANYKGEIAPYSNIHNPMPQLGIFYRYNPSEVIGIRFAGSYGKIAASDENSQEPFALLRNHAFETVILEFSSQLEYNFLNFRGGSKKNYQSWSPYLLAGIGFCKYDPITNAQPNYDTFSLILPLGVGLKATLSDNWNLGLEIGSRFTFTDYLDNLGVDVNKGLPPLNSKLYAGNPNNKDMYFFTSVSISYVMPVRGKDCPIQMPR